MTRSPALLIVHQGALGDLVCIFPVIAALRRHFRPVGILCQDHLGRLAAAEELVETWFPIEAAWTASLFAGDAGVEARRRLAPFSHILVFSPSEALASSLRGISGARVCRFPPRPPVGQRIHVTEHALGHIVTCGLITDAGLKGIERGENAKPTQRDATPVLTLLHPGAGSPRKRWPLEGFWTIADHLERSGQNPQFVIGPAEDRLAAPLEKQTRKLHRPADSLELMALLRSASAYIGNDSGASHLAAWLGIPSVVIFGPTDPMRWRPRGRSVEIVQPPLDCLPCFETSAENCAAADCLARIATANVMEAFQRVVRRD